MLARYALATASYSRFRPSMGVPVRITLGSPRHPVPGYDPGRRVPELTPRGDYFNAEPHEFDRRFCGQLDQHGVQGIAATFARIAADIETPEPTLVLLCFETIPVFRGFDAEEQYRLEAEHCHRRLFAAWWLARTGELIPELRAGATRQPGAIPNPG